MLVTLSRIIKYGWQSFLRNGWLSASTISIMILALIVFEGLILFNFLGKGALVSIQEKVDISVYFKSNISEDAILTIKKSLEGLSEVKEAQYVSREEALAEFKARHADDETITQTLSELDTNPLLASLNIKAKELGQYEAIASYLDTPTLKDLIEKVTYAQNKVVIDRLKSVVNSMEKGVVFLTLFLAFIAVMVTFNTIRLAIFSNSEQINIMRLVGASNGFIRGPYVVEGIIYGFIAAVLSFFILVPLVQFVSPHLMSFVPEVNLAQYVQGNWIRLFLYQILFGEILGIISSIIAIRKYLRV